MNFWGFSIAEARVIDYDKNDKSMATAMTHEAPASKLCIGMRRLYGHLYGRQSDRIQYPQITDAGKKRRNSRSNTESS